MCVSVIAPSLVMSRLVALTLLIAYFYFLTRYRYNSSTTVVRDEKLERRVTQPPGLTCVRDLHAHACIFSLRYSNKRRIN